MKQRTIILASASPRRRELLAELRLPFEVVPADIDERPWPNEAPASYALRNAGEKARAVFSKSGGTVIGADTIVVCDGLILEKPADTAHAREMLKLLSGRWHEVITGLCVISDDRESARAVRTEVRFKELSLFDIDLYIANGEPMDKAGAYAIQGGAGEFVAEIKGSYSNVVGFPLDEVRELLKSYQ
ncbi:MAG TPA: Maf family protein [Kiritimatiellia bacterium]|jgi:septum formation protein